MCPAHFIASQVCVKIYTVINSCWLWFQITTNVCIFVSKCALLLLALVSNNDKRGSVLHCIPVAHTARAGWPTPPTGIAVTGDIQPVDRGPGEYHGTTTRQAGTQRSRPLPSSTWVALLASLYQRLARVICPTNELKTMAYQPRANQSRRFTVRKSTVINTFTNSID